MYNKTYKRRQQRRRGKKATFAKAVKKVLMKTTELKKFDNDFTPSNISHNTMTTWNLLNGMAQGTSQGSRIGDKIYISSLRLQQFLTNYSALGTVNNNNITYRVLIFKGKYDYSSTSYPTTEVFEANNGAAPQSVIIAPVDTSQVTVLYDRTFTLANNYSGQSREIINKMVLPVKQNFYFRNDDAFQKTSNLYLGICQSNLGLAQVAPQSNVQINFKDL